MPKSKINKKRKKKVLAFKNKIQLDRKKMKDLFIKGLQESQSKKMDEQLNINQEESIVDGLGDFNLDQNSVLDQTKPIEEMQNVVSDLGLGDIEQIELSESPPDSFSGVVK